MKTERMRKRKEREKGKHGKTQKQYFHCNGNVTLEIESLTNLKKSIT